MKDLDLAKEEIFENSLRDGYLKILMNYVQNLMVFTNVNLNWFWEIKNIFLVQTAPLGLNYKVISFDCLFKGFLIIF